MPHTPYMSQLTDHLLSGLRQLATACDGARQRDHCGFAQPDVAIGHNMATLDSLTIPQTQVAMRLCTKYRRQLGEEFYGKMLGLKLLDEPAMTTPNDERSDDDDPVLDEPYNDSEEDEEDPLLNESLDSVAPLTSEQEDAIASILAWLEQGDSHEFKLGGYAGTGKTTVIKELIATLRRKHAVNVSAFTGKAVNVLRRKGVSAQTLHSLMYDVHENLDGTVSFTKKYSLKDDPGLIIVDEASMISTELYNDLLTFDVPVLYVGDPGQLEPVGENPNLMAKPHLVLSKIHRQAERSPIIRFATDIRLGKITRPQLTEGSELVIKPKVVRASEYLVADQIICAKNMTRRNLNQKIRVVKKLTDPLVVGEKLICLRNNRQFGVFNGQILFVDAIAAEGATYWACDLHDEGDRRYTHMRIWKEPFLVPNVQEGNSTQIRVPFAHIFCDYGYVITCHKSQGSEWDNVIVLDEWMPPSVWDMKRWRYTAITRAAKHLTFCI